MHHCFCKHKTVQFIIIISVEKDLVGGRWTSISEGWNGGGRCLVRKQTSYVVIVEIVLLCFIVLSSIRSQILEYYTFSICYAVHFCTKIHKCYLKLDFVTEQTLQITLTFAVLFFFFLKKRVPVFLFTSCLIAQKLQSKRERR